MRPDAFKGPKHKRAGKHDGFKPAEENEKGAKKNPPKFENFKGDPIE